MRQLASGNFDVVLPGLGRKDEIGEMASAVEDFKVRAVAKAQEDAAARETQNKSATAARSAELHRFADDFEAAVGVIVSSVSSSATQLEASATTLTRTVDATQELTGRVASASEEASANVQSVAAATEELSASVHEIGRQVQESSRIAAAAAQESSSSAAAVRAARASRGVSSARMPGIPLMKLRRLAAKRDGIDRASLARYRRAERRGGAIWQIKDTGVNAML